MHIKPNSNRNEFNFLFVLYFVKEEKTVVEYEIKKCKMNSFSFYSTFNNKFCPPYHFVCFHLDFTYHINVYIMLCYNTFNLLIAFYSLKFLYKNLLIHVLKTLRLNNLANKHSTKNV